MIIALLSALALADVAPPEDYVETCTVEIQCGPGIDGATCEQAMSSDDPMEDCQPLMDKGWVQMCTAWGGTFSDVVFCAEKPDEAKVLERAEAAATPTVGSGWCATAPVPVGVGLFLVVLAMRRR